VLRLVHQRQAHGTDCRSADARPAAELVKLAGRFQSEIHVEKDGLQVNGKSIMGVLMLAAEQGAILRFMASGTDAEEALEALTSLVRRGFEEE